jgi:hypothetical protein
MPFTLWASEDGHKKRLRGASVSFGLVGVVGIVGGSSSFDDIEGEATLELHAGGAEDGTKGARGAALLPDDLADIAGGDVKSKDGGFLFGNGFYTNGVGIVDESPCNFRHQGLHFRDSRFAVR